MRRRLDTELVRRGLVSSRDRAQAEITAGRVMVRGVPATKAARMVDADDPVALRGPGPRFVSRGGEKLDAALDQFGIDVAGRTALDAGASTGGFTDCLLQRGLAHVVAVDVGRGQLDLRLRNDARVTVRERTNIRHLAPADVGGPFDLIVADLAFISLRTVAPALLGLATAGADLVLLVKPQFEAGRVAASRERGVIRDPEVWRGALEGVVAAFAGGGAGPSGPLSGAGPSGPLSGAGPSGPLSGAAAIMGLMVSPLLGAEGNVEFLAHLLAGAPPGSAPDALIAAAVASAIVRTGEG